MLNKLTKYKGNFSDEKIREMRATAAQSISDAMDKDPEIATQWAHIEHRWLKVYRKKAGLSKQEMRDILFPETNEFIEDIESFEEAETQLTWRELRTWAEACGHKGGQISLYYLPYRSAPLRLWDRFEFWLWAKFDWKSEPKSQFERQAEAEQDASLLEKPHIPDPIDLKKPIKDTIPHEPKTRRQDREQEKLRCPDCGYVHGNER